MNEVEKTGLAGGACWLAFKDDLRSEKKKTLTKETEKTD
jgi:hypothetical protein